ncbi:MAG: SDR family oxidoreductase [Winogradskyella sp.]|uniref:SDR family oxidoreductase n=1 Tax=Winogradskyella sp. TaxID=1883156 RepID=UPI0025F192DE|nr:SDR family oxidoreductase [Winogradskyella sp.]NRB61083.1 SDR family oxidoreductase [Winogradskyella sp.]
MKKVALVTGANKGLGYQTAKELGQNGIKVLVGARNEERGNNAVSQLKNEGIDAEFVQLDVASADSIKDAVKTISENYDQLDILVNNAGMIHAKESWDADSVNSLTQDILRNTFETNFFGLVDLTQQLVPLIKKSAQGNIVNVSSILGSLEEANNPKSDYYQVKPFAYNASKAAVNSYTIHLAAALKNDKIKVNSAHPGGVQTDLGTEHAPLTVKQGARTIVDLALDTSEKTAQFEHLGQTIAW